MNDSDLEKFLAAGKIARKAQDYARTLLAPGKKLLGIAEAIEEKTIREGGGIAFPVNLSLNECAAHYTPKVIDETAIAETDVLKVDIGVHVDGFIADCAFSYSHAKENHALIEASEKALASALQKMVAGNKNGDAGRAIENEIRAMGFTPVENLCGHSLAQNKIHAGQEIPNTAHGTYALKEGDVFAVEPFASTGTGFVKHGSECEIYALASPGKKARLSQSREILEFVEKNYSTRPFAKRWLSKAGFSDAKISLALQDLERQRIFHGYPTLVDSKGCKVSQAETSVIVGQGGAKDILGT